MNSYLPISFENDQLVLLDQRKLPLVEEFIKYDSLEGGFEAIQNMVVRGAPCIGFTAIYSLALWLKNHSDFTLAQFEKACSYLKTARPTAVNLNYEVNRVFNLVKECLGVDNKNFFTLVKDFGDLQIINSEKQNRAMAIWAQKDLQKTLGLSRYQILTHCNTGFLACGSLGTALGVVQHLFEQDQLENVWVDETRPYLQGSRLTAYELDKLGAPHKIVVEGAASYLMRNKLVDAIFTGADRITANGDTANKVGTSNLAILANYYDIPFYVVAPSSSFDLSLASGKEIEIELRDEDEILQFHGQRIAPANSSALNPSFDITPGELIIGIISEKGICKGHYAEKLEGIVRG